MVLTAYIVLSPVTGLVCHRHRRRSLRQLDGSVGASGPHDFAVRKSALSSVAPPASTASRPHVRDDRETPLVRSGTARGLEVIWVKREAEYFCKQDWTTQITLILFKKSRFWRTRSVARFRFGASRFACHRALVGVGCKEDQRRKRASSPDQRAHGPPAFDTGPPTARRTHRSA